MSESLSKRHEQLAYTTTADGLLLEGVIVRPPAGAVPSLSFVWIHGNAARFYDYGYVSICRALAEAGFPCVSGNTRGHDIAAFVWRGADGRPRPWRSPRDFPIGAGAGWEALEDAPLDVAAWVDVAAELSDGVVLVGHSSGAQRVVLYQAQRQDPRITGLALASPDLQGFMPAGELELAQHMVAEGRGQEAVPAQPFAPFYRQSAAAIVSRANVLAGVVESAVPAIRCPVLAFYGDLETGAPRLDIASHFSAAARLDQHTIPGADHAYSATESEVAQVLASWATSLT
jgi:hypothetical protein